MWHEARRQEKKIRGMMVDQKKRAERRREFYEKIQKSETNLYLRMYGRSMRIHIDPSIAMAATAPQSMIAWNGDVNNMIDRFDVRGNMDVIPDVPAATYVPTSEEIADERRCNYERYRTVVENECAGILEEQCLQQIFMDEQFGPLPSQATNQEEKKKLAKTKAAIGFSYDDNQSENAIDKRKEELLKELEEESDKSDDTDIEDADLDVTIDVNKLTSEQAKLLNECAHHYGMKDQDFVMMLLHDREELEELREARLLEEQRAQYSGRKSRRERRAYKEKRLQGRTLSPPSYAAVETLQPKIRRESSSSSSRSRSKEREKVKFITSFGLGSDDEDEAVVQGPSLPQSGSHDSATWRNTSGTPRNRPTTGRSGKYASNKHLSRSARSRSRSKVKRSRSRSHSFTKTSHRSRSPSLGRKKPTDVPIVKRYRRPSLDSSNDSEDSDKEQPPVKHQKTPSLPPAALVKRDDSKTKTASMTVREKLERKMQIQIKKTFLADRKAEIIKLNKKEEERMNREEEIRARVAEMRRREREKRMLEDSDSSGSEYSDRRRSRHDDDRRSVSPRNTDRGSGDRHRGDEASYTSSKTGQRDAKDDHVIADRQQSSKDNGHSCNERSLKSDDASYRLSPSRRGHGQGYAYDHRGSPGRRGFSPDRHSYSADRRPYSPERRGRYHRDQEQPRSSAGHSWREYDRGCYQDRRRQSGSQSESRHSRYLDDY